MLVDSRSAVTDVSSLALFSGYVPPVQSLLGVFDVS
jgi:hypothetical protein